MHNNTPHTPQRRPRRILAGCGLAALGVAVLAAGCEAASTPSASANHGHHASASAAPEATTKSPAAATTTPHTKKHSRHKTEANKQTSVTMIGDSVTVRSTPELQKRLPGVVINAKVGRQLTTAPGLVRAEMSQGRMGNVLVIALGTNGNGGAADLNAAIDAAGPHRKVVLVNIDAARSWQDPMNRTIASVAADRSNVTLADWHRTIAGKEYLLVDGVHPNAAGEKLFAETVAGAVHKATS